MIVEAEYGRLFHKGLLLIHKRDLESLEKAAKLLLVAKILHLEGLAVTLEAFVKRMGLHEHEIPSYLKPIFGQDGSCDDWLQAGWNMLAKKVYGNDGKQTFLNKLRLWWIYNKLKDESKESKLVLSLLQSSVLPAGWGLTEVEEALCL